MGNKASEKELDDVKKAIIERRENLLPSRSLNYQRFLVSSMANCSHDMLISAHTLLCGPNDKIVSGDQHVVAAICHR